MKLTVSLDAERGSDGIVRGGGYLCSCWDMLESNSMEDLETDEQEIDQDEASMSQPKDDGLEMVYDDSKQVIIVSAGGGDTSFGRYTSRPMLRDASLFSPSGSMSSSDTPRSVCSTDNAPKSFFVEHNYSKTKEDIIRDTSAGITQAIESSEDATCTKSTTQVGTSKFDGDDTFELISKIVCCDDGPNSASTPDTTQDAELEVYTSKSNDLCQVTKAKSPFDRWSNNVCLTTSSTADLTELPSRASTVEEEDTIIAYAATLDADNELNGISSCSSIVVNTVQDVNLDNDKTLRIDAVVTSNENASADASRLSNSPSVYTTAPSVYTTSHQSYSSRSVLKRCDLSVDTSYLRDEDSWYSKNNTDTFDDLTTPKLMMMADRFTDQALVNPCLKPVRALGDLTTPKLMQRADRIFSTVYEEDESAPSPTMQSVDHLFSRIMKKHGDTSSTEEEDEDEDKRDELKLQLMMLRLELQEELELEENERRINVGSDIWVRGSSDDDEVSAITGITKFTKSVAPSRAKSREADLEREVLLLRTQLEAQRRR